MSEISLRKASEQDLEQVFRYIKTFLLDDENLVADHFIIAEYSGNFAGFGRIKAYREVYELSSIGVVQEFRRLGIGKAIIEHLIQTFPTNEVWITTKIPEYFIKFGFVETSNPPYEIKEKRRRLCVKNSKSPSEYYYMVLNRK